MLKLLEAQKQEKEGRRGKTTGREEGMRQDRKEPVVGVKSLRRHEGKRMHGTWGLWARHMAFV